MVKSYISDVKAFHDKFGLVTPPSFTFTTPEIHAFRVAFLREEFKEYVDAYDELNLEIALDSLLDLVYVACGTALFAGVHPEVFDVLMDQPTTGTVEFNAAEERIYFRPQLLTQSSHLKLVENLGELIRRYDASYQLADEEELKTALVGIVKSCLIGSLKMGVTPDVWDELWDDVQRANMSKERATSADQSKRGSTLDVIKPIGWVGPRGAAILAKYI